MGLWQISQQQSQQTMHRFTVIIQHTSIMVSEKKRSTC